MLPIVTPFRHYLGQPQEFFQNYFLHTSDVTFDFSDNSTTIHNRRTENWRVTLVDTGLDTMTGGRIKKIQSYIGDENFCMTYGDGDGVGDVDIGALCDFHLSRGRKATVTTVSPPGRFGAVNVDGDIVTGFQEKPRGEGGLINGGFFVLSPDIFDYIDGPDTVWERDPLERLAADGQLAARPHDGFWCPLDTLRDKQYLEHLWASGDAPWRVWG